jgi:hypothetical protein
MPIIKTSSNALRIQKAKRLYVYQYKSAKETALAVCATEKTVGAWIKLYGWKTLREEVINNRLATNAKDVQPFEITLLDFLEYAKENAPHVAVKIEPLITNYVNLIK